ncbi:unnamed protein product, partial [Didymodactylos carnosus]
KSIKNTLSQFRHTHHDQWHEHREKFTEDQLATIADVLISPHREKCFSDFDNEKIDLVGPPNLNRQTNIELFFEWLHKHNVDTSKFELCSFDNYGLGPKATQELENYTYLSKLREYFSYDMY